MPDTKAPEILVAETPADLDSVRALHRRFVDWHMVRHAAFRDKLDAYFTPAAFEAELAALPGAFAPPSGRLLLARLGGQDAGCVGLRDRGGGVAEMKRMFVVPEAQGRGVGRALAGAIIAAAREMGFDTMRLDSGPLQHEAHALYESLGFRRIGPYHDLPEDMADWLIFMEADLRRTAGDARVSR